MIPHPIRALPWRFKQIRQTSMFSRRPVRSTLRLADWTLRELVCREISFRSPDGTPFVSMPNNFSSLVTYVANDRDPSIQDFIRRRIGPGCTFVDVGANIGTYSVRAGKLVGDKGRVIALEAHPATYRYLKQNIAGNGLNNVTMLQRAAGDADGTIEMEYVQKNPGETHVALGKSDATVSVEIQTIDKILAQQGIRHVDYLKIDVEGFELPVLKGAVETIENNPDMVIQVEFDERHAQRYGYSTSEVSGLLTKSGRMPHHAEEGGGLRSLDRIPKSGNFDILWLRR